MYQTVQKEVSFVTSIVLNLTDENRQQTRSMEARQFQSHFLRRSDLVLAKSNLVLKLISPVFMLLCFHIIFLVDRYDKQESALQKDLRIQSIILMCDIIFTMHRINSCY